MTTMTPRSRATSTGLALAIGAGLWLAAAAPSGQVQAIDRPRLLEGSIDIHVHSLSRRPSAIA